MEKYRKHQTYDVIIPVAKKDCFFLRYVIKYIRINLPEAEQIYIITNKNNIKRVSRYIDKQCLLINEGFLLKGLTYEHTKRLIEDAGGDIKRTGWYFQQLLKYAFSYSKYAKEYYLSWDSDTLPLQHLSFFTDGHSLFTGKAEYHKPYFHTMQRLIGIGKIVNYSFIAEHMIFKCSIVRELLQKIENNSPAKYNWVESIIHACDFAHEVNCFSEFETYGTYCIKFILIYTKQEH